MKTNHLTLFYLGSGKTLLPGGAIMAPPDFLLYGSSKSGTNTQNLFPDKIFDIYAFIYTNI